LATYQTEFNADVNLQALDQLREQFALPAAGATSTTPAVEPDLIIKETSAGYLNVRQGPGVNFPKIGQVDTGSQQQLLEEQNGWYKIGLDDGQEGWVSAVYVDKLK